MGRLVCAMLAHGEEGHALSQERMPQAKWTRLFCILLHWRCQPHCAQQWTVKNHCKKFFHERANCSVHCTQLASGRHRSVADLMGLAQEWEPPTQPSNSLASMTLQA
jgi:hypothetical protein